MKKIIILSVLGIALAAGVFVYLKDSSRAAEKAIIYSYLPRVPDLSFKPKALSRRIEKTDTAIQKGDRPTESLIELARLYHANGFHKEAVDCYAALSEIQPAQARWPHLTAVILDGNGQLDEAVPLFEAAVKNDPSYPPSAIRLGNALLKQNRFAEADAAFQIALAAEKNQPHALLGRSRCLIAKNAFAQARPLLQTAFRTSGNRVGGDLLVSVYTELGLTEEALKTEQASQVGAHNDLQDPWLLDLYSDCYDPYQLAIVGGQASYGGDPELGYSLLQRAERLDPDNAMYPFQLGNLALSSGKVAQAEAHFKRSIELQPSFSDGWGALYNIYQKNGDAARAAATLKTGYRNAPASPALMILLAKEAKAEGRLQDAADLLKRSTRYRPNEAAAYIEMAQILFEIGSVDEGTDMMRSALQAEPGHPLPLTTLALDAIIRGKKAEAAALLQQVAAHPRIPRAHSRELEAKFRQAFTE